MRRALAAAAAVVAATVALAPGGALAQYDADPFHPTYTIEEISNAQGECQRMCIEAKERPRAGCLTELGVVGQWSCEVALVEEGEYKPCKNRLRSIQLSSLSCECVKTSAGDCVNAFQVMYDVWKDVPVRYRQEPRVRAQQ